MSYKFMRLVVSPRCRGGGFVFFRLTSPDGRIFTRVAGGKHTLKVKKGWHVEYAGSKRWRNK